MNSARDVAIFLSHEFRYSWDSLGFFDLHRLLYLAQGWHLASRNCQLFNESISAQKAIPLTFGIKGVVPSEEMIPIPNLDPDAKAFLNAFCLTFANADRAAIRRQVEREDGAWRLAQAADGEGATIHADLMKATFNFMMFEYRDTKRAERSKGLEGARISSKSNIVTFPNTYARAQSRYIANA